MDKLTVTLKTIDPEYKNVKRRYSIVRNMGRGTSLSVEPETVSFIKTLRCARS